MVGRQPGKIGPVGFGWIPPDSFLAVARSPAPGDDRSMKAPFVLLGVLAATALLTACPETKVPRHFGVKPVILKPAAWEGDWSSADEPDEAMHFSIRDARQGIFDVVEPAKEGKKAEPPVEVMVSHQSADKEAHLFFLTTFDKPGDAAGSINLISREGDHLFNLWHPNHEAIARAIKSGQLKGTVKKVNEDTRSMLEADPANYKALASPEYWDWTKPQAFFKRGPRKH